MPLSYPERSPDHLAAVEYFLDYDKDYKPSYQTLNRLGEAAINQPKIIENSFEKISDDFLKGFIYNQFENAQNLFGIIDLKVPTINNFDTHGFDFSNIAMRLEAMDNNNDILPVILPTPYGLPLAQWERLFKEATSQAGRSSQSYFTNYKLHIDSSILNAWHLDKQQPDEAHILLNDKVAWGISVIDRKTQTHPYGLMPGYPVSNTPNPSALLAYEASAELMKTHPSITYQTHNFYIPLTSKSYGFVIAKVDANGQLSIERHPTIKHNRLLNGYASVNLNTEVIK